jgi:hypothetical protein
MAKYEVSGYFSTESCKKIKGLMQGKTFLNFNIEYGGTAGNNSIVVSSDTRGYTDKDLVDMFVFYALNLL